MKRRAAISAFIICALTAPCVLPAVPAPGSPVTSDSPIIYGQGVELAELANQSINESSGIACSRSSPGIFWTHNDSGGEPVLYAFNPKGEDLGEFPVKGAKATDWEDIASFALSGQNYLLVADTGDNATRRDHCTLFIAREPDVVDKTTRPTELALISEQDFVYEDGPRNCESAAVDSTRREVLLVSKMTDPSCKVYMLPLPGKGRPKQAVAKAIATLSIPTTTAMDISPDGLRAVVLTYKNAYEYTRGATEDWGKAFASEPRVLTMPDRKQGESICYGPDGRTLYLTSEKRPTPLIEVAPKDTTRRKP